MNDHEPTLLPPATVRHRSFGAQLAVIFVARTVLNTGYRIIYPFLPAIARGLGVSLATATGLVSMRLISGLVAPFIGPLADRQSRRRTMVAAMIAFALACALLVWGGSLAAGGVMLALAGTAFALLGISKVVFDPAVHAYMGDSVPYTRRARAVGTVELAWSGAWLLGVPATGFLMESMGWQAPWIVLVGLGLGGAILIQIGLPMGHPPTPVGGHPRGVRATLASWSRLVRRPRVAWLLLTSLMLTMAQEIPFIVYGAWLESSFGLSLSTLGLASIVVGVVEAVAELGTTVFTDRLGKQRSVLLGLAAMAAGLALLPVAAGQGLVPALAGFALVTVAFEFGIVSLIPLATELVPEARASLLSLNVTAFSLGRMGGAVVGGWLWSWGLEGIAPHAAAGAVCALLAGAAVWRGLREG
ncbi:MAG: MFS transporter [Anaerolineae bacterium]|nr:MFS transporter [Anaerolineae bacterium]